MTWNTLLGLDLGTSAVKAVEVSRDGREPVITAFAGAEIPDGADVAEVLAAVLGDGRFQSDRVVTALSGPSTIVRFVAMPQLPEADLKRAIRHEVDKYVPFDADDLAIDCTPLGSSRSGDEGEQDVLLAACRREVATERVELVEGHGLASIAVDLELCALANAWELFGADGGDGTVALVDVGASKTTIHTIARGRTVFAREIPIGGVDLTEAIAGAHGFDTPGAERRKTAQDASVSKIGVALGPVLDDLANELLLSVDYVEHSHGLSVDRFALSGGGLLAPGAVPRLQRTLGRPARTWDPLAGLRVDSDRVDTERLEAWKPRLAVAAGLAGWSREHGGIDLTPGEPKRRGALRRLWGFLNRIP